MSEEDDQDERKLKTNPACQHGMHLDGKLTLQTWRKFTSAEPATQEQLRAKCTVLQNMWLLAVHATRQVDLQGSHQNHFR